jgi:hypothetical protein
MRKLLIILLLLLSDLCVAQNYRILDWEFRLSILHDDPVYSYLDLDIYSRSSSPWGFWRGMTKEKPGDYFDDIYAQETTVDSSVFKAVWDTYRKYINDSILGEVIYSTKWYTSSYDSAYRKEYFVRYTDNKYVYVISGWWPKFIKFYKATPKDITLSESDVRNDLRVILKDKSLSDKFKFSMESEGDFYILKAQNENYMIRNYKISASAYEGRQTGADLGQPPPMFSNWYNIIEITIYLDKEYIP